MREEDWVHVDGNGGACEEGEGDAGEAAAVEVDDLAEDSLVCVMSYLSAEEVLGMSLCNKRMYRVSREAFVWQNMCSRRWALLSEVVEGGHCVKFREESGSLRGRDGRVALAALHGLSQPHPTRVDYKCLQSGTARRSRRRRCNSEFRTFDMTLQGDHASSVRVIQFTGETGRGDRCIRSDQPFPILEVYHHPHSETHLDPESDHDTSTTTRGRWCPHLLLDFVKTVLSTATHAASTVGFTGTSAPTMTRTSSFVSTTPTPCQQIIKTATLLPPDLPLPQTHQPSTSSFWSLPIFHTMQKTVTLRPYVAPFVHKANGKTKQMELNVTPRLFGYFEVTILPRDEKQEPPMPSTTTSTSTSSSSSLFAFDQDNDDDEAEEDEQDNTHNNPHQNNNPNNPTSECIAIGLSTTTFHHHHKMPGWDAFSYGYHSDDGGIFHANGDMVAKFGPKFGGGDTVGCGIDYVQKAIFYTLNGRFLGYAFEDVGFLDAIVPSCGDGGDDGESVSEMALGGFSLSPSRFYYKHQATSRGKNATYQNRGLYPTIGMDSNSPVACNFGERPFVFDVGEIMRKHEDLIDTAFSGFPCREGGGSLSCQR